ncbi:YigZ family protein [Gracilibacillus sp. HCP3S3_G5_1]|uniref:YigZ family protein n=1 Tax=unclassified Gracilibacillus TaxID=2625209 RepID=UPI003F8CA134
MLNHYFTVKPEGSDEQIIQKSRFIGYVRRVTSEKEAQQFIQEIKNKHADATHNCSAYMIGEHDQIQKANDDGEPSGTAGVPILEVLKKRQLKDTAVVVTRYFGGIKLGAGGLIRAYSSTTSLAINSTGVVERKRMKKFLVTINYTLLGKVENELRQSPYLLEEMEYVENVTFHVRTPVGVERTFIDWITNLTSGSAEIKEGEDSYIELDVATE